jgi:hypothetical protein
LHPSSIEQQLSDRPLSNQISPASVAHRLKSLITSFVDSRTRVNVSADLERLLRQLEAQTEEAASFFANHHTLDAPAWKSLSTFVYFGAIKKKTRIHSPAPLQVPMRLNSR